MTSANRTVIPRPALFVGGRWVTTDEVEPVLNPADESVVGPAPVATVEHAAAALEAAERAQGAWARRSGTQRGAVLRAVADRILAHREPLAHLVALEQGKTIVEARGEIAGTAEFFRYYSTFERGRVGGVWASEEPEEHLLIRNVPYGVVVGIIPWNFPAALFARKVAPAIMAGNAIVMKPHSDTPLSALALAAVVQEAGVPDGVVNVVTGDGPTVGDALVRHPLTDLVTVTGSVRAGREILAAAAPGITSVSLELGGKAPFLVFPDADLESAIAGAVEARFWNCGQVCTCNERTYVHRSVYDRFVEGVVRQAQVLRVGDPMDEHSEMGPKVNESEWRKVHEIVERARRDGAEVVLGGGRPVGEAYERGYWYAPTVLTGVDHGMDVMREEIFGPVLPVQPVDDVEEAVHLANDTPYGLTAYVYTNDFSTAMKAMDDLRFGEVYVNRVGPEQLQGFHGGYGLSGMGGDDGEHGYERYQRKKTAYLRYGGEHTYGQIPPQ